MVTAESIPEANEFLKELFDFLSSEDTTARYIRAALKGALPNPHKLLYEPEKDLILLLFRLHTLLTK